MRYRFGHVTLDFSRQRNPQSPLCGFTNSFAMLVPCGMVTMSDSGFRASGSGLRISCSGLRVPNFGFQVLGFEFRVSGLRLRVLGFMFRVSGFEFRVPCFVFRVPCFGFRVSGSRFRVSGFGFWGVGTWSGIFVGFQTYCPSTISYCPITCVCVVLGEGFRVKGGV